MKEESSEQTGADGAVFKNQHSDEVLIQAIVDKEIWAMESLYQRYHRVIYVFSFRLVSDQQVAENLTQETFLAVWQHATTYSPQAGTVRTWLLSIVQHRTIDYLRALQRRSILHEINWDAIEEEELPTVPDAWDEVWKSTLIDQVRANNVPAIFGSEVYPSKVLEVIGRETGAQYISSLRDDDLPGLPAVPLDELVRDVVGDRGIRLGEIGIEHLGTPPRSSSTLSSAGWAYRFLAERAGLRSGQSFPAGRGHNHITGVPSSRDPHAGYSRGMASPTSNGSPGRLRE